MTVFEALLALAIALAVSTLLTPLAAAFARKVGAVDEPKERGLSNKSTPLLGGLAILAGITASTLIWLAGEREITGVLLGAVVVVLIGTLDDIFDLSPIWKLLGQIAAAVVVTQFGVTVENITIPFLGALTLGDFATPLTIFGLVVVMNVVNLTDGVDGLAAGVCTIAALALAVIAIDLGKDSAAMLAVITAGAAFGFLLHNFHPASVFMGDSGSNLLGYMLGCTAILGTLKTNAVVALVLPLVVLAVPFLDTSFVVAKRIKYRRPIYRGDAWHFHHRFANIGFSQRRTVFYLYAWTASMAGLALALRFIPYSENDGSFNLGPLLLLVACAVVVLAGSIYLVLVLEILKFKRLRSRQLRSSNPETTEHEVEERVAKDLETGEFSVIRLDSDEKGGSD